MLLEEVNPPAPLIRGVKDRFIGWNTGVEEVRFYFVNGKEVFPFLKLCSISRNFEVEFFGDAIECEAVIGGKDKLLFQPETFLKFFNMGEKIGNFGGDVVNEFCGFKPIITIC